MKSEAGRLIQKTTVFDLKNYFKTRQNKQLVRKKTDLYYSQFIYFRTNNFKLKTFTGS
jgi:hypothetical protein